MTTAPNGKVSNQTMCRRFYNPFREDRTARLIGVSCVGGVLFSLLAFFPGWMTPDSVWQYADARADKYHSWHPVLMAWWWHKLDIVYAGPTLLLVQNLLLYWGAWALVASASRIWIGPWAGLIPLIGFCPGLLFPLGQIWKDVCFATSIFFAWAVLINIYSQARRPKAIERAAVYILAVFGFGVKTNGLVVLPFLFGFWIFVERWCPTSRVRRGLINIGLAVAVVALPILLVPTQKIIKQDPFQYTQLYDLLAISVRTDRNLLPTYVSEKVGNLSGSALGEFYSPCGNDRLFYKAAGNLTTENPVSLAELRNRWMDAILKYPMAYFIHRMKTFACLLRLGSSTAAFVARPGIDDNPYGLMFITNSFSKMLASTTHRIPWMFFPWLYLVALLASTSVLIAMKWHVPVVLYLGGSSISFMLPHIFIAPVWDYRYLFYCSICSLTLTSFCGVVLLRRALDMKSDR